MQAYCAYTGTLTTHAAIKAAGWRWLATPVNARAGMNNYALDNGAWGHYVARRAFDEKAFNRAVLAYGDAADFIVLPDIVMGGAASLELSLRYLNIMERFRKLLIPVQNGMNLEDVAPYLSTRVGIFLGGDTEWKLQHGEAWGLLAMTKGAHFHVGRVNTARRIHWCADINADSFDGSSVAQFPDTIFALEAARQRPSLLRKKE